MTMCYSQPAVNRESMLNVIIDESISGPIYVHNVQVCGDNKIDCILQNRKPMNTRLGFHLRYRNVIIVQWRATAVFVCCWGRRSPAARPQAERHASFISA